VILVYGVPPERVVEVAHERRIVVMGSATTVEDAVAFERGGVATGSEAAGHRVSFLRTRQSAATEAHRRAIAGTGANDLTFMRGLLSCGLTLRLVPAGVRLTQR
jgi:NAD(P)H-dependent flavin oxidoreductase YrpB (nitropropane dioxygenase family)